MSLKRIPRGRNGGRPVKISANRKPVQANLYIPAEDLEVFCDLVPVAADRNKLVGGWVAAYNISRGESDRLLAQSPTVLKILTYLEATDAPEYLRDELQSLIVNRELEELRGNGAIELPGDSYIV